jgi:DNA-binding NtrC family response regulator
MTTPTPLIHVVDDDESLRTALLRLLDAAGFNARGYASVGDFLLQPPPDSPGCVLLDVRMPGPSGLDLQAALLRQGNALPVVSHRLRRRVCRRAGDEGGGVGFSDQAGPTRGPVRGGPAL